MPLSQPTKRTATLSKSPTPSTASAPSTKNSKPPLYTTASKDLYAYWYNVWYPIEIVKNTIEKSKGGQWIYEIRWTGYTNSAKKDKLPTNESSYPESWIFHKNDIPPEELAAKLAPASPTKSPKPRSSSKPKSTPAKSPTPKAPKSTGYKPPKKPSAKPSTTPLVSSESSPGVLTRTASRSNSLPSSPAPKPKANKSKSRTPAPKPASFTFISDTTSPAVYKYSFKWQYYDPSRPPQWHDYEISGSDVVEEAYQSWAADPAIDVRSVKSGRFNYMVDFNQMQQTNVDHPAHTVRRIRRAKVSDGSLAMDEAHTIQRTVSLQRLKAAQERQLSGDTSATS